MERVISVSRSFEECDRADKAYYRTLSPQQRLEILWELNRRWPASGDDETVERLERVYRVIKLS
jgi:hypothetical protein